tara:strand:- start:4012 stop:4134 length:123 start_codon:yes stop_codon:yes gene_type:complete
LILKDLLLLISSKEFSKEYKEIVIKTIKKNKKESIFIEDY